MKLYYAPGACSLADHIVAVEGGLTLDLEKVDLKAHITESGVDFRKINPKGYVPALELDDGSLLTENSAILAFLGDQAGLMPEGMDRYRALEWIGYISTEIHKSFGPLFHDSAQEVKTKAKDKIRQRLQLAEEKLSGGYLLGGKFSPPDAYLFVMLRWCDKNKIDLAAMPRLTAFKARMENRAGVSKALKQEGLQ
ncbi:MAG: glutathione S-transferase family protein [Alphaproteobacteria bacterium]|nr:glutathione S-transferase family protein [Alphaproteobacteria bacterium]